MNKIVRILVLAIGLSLNCDLFYQPPDNLKLLLVNDNYTLYCPAWSSTGKIYFLATDAGLGSRCYFGGSLWVCDTSGENSRLLCDGTFGYLAVSPNGSKLALTRGYLVNDGYYEGGSLILIDSSGVILDTIPSSEPKVVSAKFSYDGSRIFYYAFGGDSSGFYCANIDGSNEEFLKAESYPTFFDLTKEDSIIISPYGDAVCALSPLDSNLLIWAGIIGNGSFLALHNLTTQKDSILDVKPYKHSTVSFPCWFSDGKRVVFSAAEIRGFEGWPGNGRLWILDFTKEE